MDSQTEIYKALIISIIGGVIVLLIDRIWLRFSRSIDKLDQRYSIIPLGSIWLVWTLVLIVYFLKAKDAVNDIWSVLLISLLSLSLLFVVWRRLKQFWGVGLRTVKFDQREEGEYIADLKLCHNQLDFLGTGAAKLSRTGEFEEALARCHRVEQPIRFLLCNPRNENLEQAAKLADKRGNRYQEIVTESLQKIYEIKKRRGINLEVRFYTRSPIFRLMFINRHICITSFMSFEGQGNGSQLPHIYLTKARGADSSSLYRAMETYFNAEWESAEAVDLDKFLNNE